MAYRHLMIKTRENVVNHAHRVDEIVDPYTQSQIGNGRPRSQKQQTHGFSNNYDQLPWLPPSAAHALPRQPT